MSDQEYRSGGVVPSRLRPEDQPPPYRRPRPIEDSDEYAESPPRREPPRRRGKPAQSSHLVPLLWTVIALLVVISAGLVAAIVFDVFTPKAAPATRAASPAAPAAPQIEVTKRQAYGDWVYTCIKIPNTTGTRCQISQQLSDSRTKQPLFAWHIGQDGKGGLVSEWETRSGVLVDRGIVIDAGMDKPLTVPFQACLPQACTAVVSLTPDAIAGLERAKSASATIVPVGGQPLKLAFSVKGLSDALTALQGTPEPQVPQAAAPGTPAATAPSK